MVMSPSLMVGLVLSLPIISSLDFSAAGKPGKLPGEREAPNNHLRRCVTFAGHFARNTRISNILRVI